MLTSRRSFFALLAAAPTAGAVAVATPAPAKAVTATWLPTDGVLPAGFPVDQVITHALVRLGVLDAGEAPCAYELDYCRHALIGLVACMRTPREYMLRCAPEFKFIVTNKLANYLAVSYGRRAA